MNDDSTKILDSRSYPLANEDFEKIAQRAAEIVVDQVALRIGQSVIKMTFYVFVAVVLAATAWVTGKEFMK